VTTKITREQNETLTRVGPGTPMGDALRRYWIPACLQEEIAEPDCPPVRVRLLGEDLVAFRDSAGQVGLLSAYCAHRLAPLFFGRNEECGLRCVYHGWKFDVTGQCVDTPSEPPFSRLSRRMSVTAYPTWEGGGIVWAYLGPEALMPDPPDYEWLRAPSTHYRVSKTGEPCNYLQAVEGGIDTAHSSFAHNNDLSNSRLLRNRDTHPELEVEVTDYGFRYASIRSISQDTSYLRIYQFIMPNQQMRGGLLDREGNPARLPSVNGHVWVPIDDENTFVYNWKYSADERSPISDEQWAGVERQAGRGQEHFIPGSYWLKLSPENDYGIDRERQRTQNFTGILGVNTQDFALQTGMGRIVDRSLEHPGSSDVAIVAARRLLLQAAADAAANGPLRGTDPGSYRMIRAADAVVDAAQSWREAMKDALVARW
jgi:phenylpropionate dioxygenase-like ring-hydroxylating dioxygenase large terminal subunit